MLVLCSILCPDLPKKKKKPTQKYLTQQELLIKLSLSSCLIMWTYSLDKSSLTLKFLGCLISVSEYCLGIDEAFDFAMPCQKQGNFTVLSQDEPSDVLDDAWWFPVCFVRNEAKAALLKNASSGVGAFLMSTLAVRALTH